MSDFGVLLSTGSGNPFVTPISVPMSMYGRYEYQAVGSGNSASAGGSIPWNPAWPAMVFLKASRDNVAVSSQKTANSLLFGGSINASVPFTLTVYVFGIFTQSAPEWGLVVYDTNGEIVLTNETRVLSDITTIGNPNIANQSGIGMDITMPGSWAVCPKIHGALIFQTVNPGSGQPIITNITVRSACGYSGGNTRFTSSAGSTNGSGSQVGYTDSRCTLVAINTAAYD